MSSSNTLMYNPENPYVFNENYFKNTSHVVYKKTTFYLVSRISLAISTSLSLFLIVLVCFLILFKTPKLFKSYSRALLVCAVIEFYILGANFLCQTRFRVVQNIMLFSLSGPLSSLSYKNQCYAFGLQVSSGLFATIGLPVQYYIRYRIIKYNNRPSALRIIFYFMIATLLIFPTLYSAGLTVCTLDNTNRTDFAEYWYHEDPIPQLLVSNSNYYILKLTAAYAVTISSSAYLLSIFLARTTLSILKKNTSYASPKTKALQEQFARTLFFQSLCPLVITILPTILSVLATFLSFELPGDYSIMIFNYFPALNCMSTIVFIVPYRNYCIRLLCSWRERVNPNSITSVIPMSIQPPIQTR